MAKRKAVRVVVLMEKGEWKRLTALAKSQNVSLGELIRSALSERRDALSARN